MTNSTYAKQLNPNKANRRSAVQWYFPLRSKRVFSGCTIIKEVGGSVNLLMWSVCRSFKSRLNLCLRIGGVWIVKKIESLSSSFGVFSLASVVPISLLVLSFRFCFSTFRCFIWRYLADNLFPGIQPFKELNIRFSLNLSTTSFQRKSLKFETLLSETWHRVFGSKTFRF